MPGGVVVNPPEAIRAAVRRQIPTLPIEHFDRIGSIYNIEREHRPQTPAKVRHAMQSLSEKAAALWVELGQLSEEAQDALFNAALKAGRPSLIEETSFPLQMLMGLARNAALDVGETPAGARAGARRGMVLSLANLLNGIGLEADARPTGDLVFLTTSILQSYGEDASNPAKIVRDALNTIEQN